MGGGRGGKIGGNLRKIGRFWRAFSAEVIWPDFCFQKVLWLFRKDWVDDGDHWAPAGRHGSQCWRWRWLCVLFWRRTYGPLWCRGRVSQSKGALKMILKLWEEDKQEENWPRKTECSVSFECGASERDMKPAFRPCHCQLLRGLGNVTILQTKKLRLRG